MLRPPGPLYAKNTEFLRIFLLIPNKLTNVKNSFSFPCQHVKWSEVLHILFFLNPKKSFSWTVFCFHYTKIKFKAWQIYYIKKWWCTGGPTWIIPVQYLPIGRNSTWYFIFTNRSKAINSWKSTLCVTKCYVKNKHSTENSFANLGIHWTLHHYTLYVLHLSPRPFRVSWKPIKSVKI